jgi:two-component system response regulator YesN
MGVFSSRLLSAEVQRRLVYYPRVLDAALYVRDNLSRTIRLDVVAERAGMTPCAFSRYFTEKVGITFTTMMKILRIEHALGLIECGDGAISDLAEQTGYQSCCTFSRAFKEIIGKTPSEYRRRVLFGVPAEEAS